MKNAPDIHAASATEATTQTAPAAPVVSRVASRAPLHKPKAGDSYNRPVMGRSVTFTLKVIPAAEIAQRVSVWGNNERLQDHLTETSLADILPSMRLDGQDVPAYGREIDGGAIEAADGSRRRMAAILAPCDYLIWVADLSDLEMDHFTKIGNQYLPPSAYERGCRYKRLLNEGAFKNQRELGDAEGVSHKIIGRCLQAASLPSEIINLFPRLNDLSARSGETLAKNRNSHMLEAAKKMAGQQLDPEQIVSALVAASSPAKEAEPPQWSNNHWSIKAAPGKGVKIELGEEIPEKLRAKIAAWVQKQLEEKGE